MVLGLALTAPFYTFFHGAQKHSHRWCKTERGGGGEKEGGVMGGGGARNSLLKTFYRNVNSGETEKFSDITRAVCVEVQGVCVVQSV